MFEKGVRFKGTTASNINDLMRAKYFDRNTDVLSWSALIGYAFKQHENHYDNEEEKDVISDGNGRDETTDEASSVQKSVAAENVEVRNIEFSYKMLSLMQLIRAGKADKARELVFGAKSAHTLKDGEYEGGVNNVAEKSKLEQDFKMYVHYGIQIMHDALCPENLNGIDEQSMSCKIKKARYMKHLVDEINEKINLLSLSENM